MAIKAPTTHAIEQIRKDACRIRDTKAALSDGKDGYEALCFLSRLHGSIAKNVASISVDLTSGGFEERKAAQSYVTIAADQMLEDIIQRAIDLAQADFDKARALLKVDEA